MAGGIPSPRRRRKLPACRSTPAFVERKLRPHALAFGRACDFPPGVRFLCTGNQNTLKGPKFSRNTLSATPGQTRRARIQSCRGLPLLVRVWAFGLARVLGAEAKIQTGNRTMQCGAFHESYPCVFLFNGLPARSAAETSKSPTKASPAHAWRHAPCNSRCPWPVVGTDDGVGLQKGSESVNIRTRQPGKRKDIINVPARLLL